MSFCSCFFFFSPFSIAIISLGVEGANLSAFRTFVRFVLVWICLFSLPLGVWEGLRFVIVAVPGLFSYLFFYIFLHYSNHYLPCALSICIKWSSFHELSATFFIMLVLSYLTTVGN